MGRVPNYKARELVIARHPFRGGNIFARTVRLGYCVYSYTETWPLYLYWGHEWFGNCGTYSRTTSRHKSMLQPQPTENIVWLPRAILELCAAYIDGSSSYASMPMSSFLDTLGYQSATTRFLRATAPPPAPVTTHMANTVVDWTAVRKRRVMPV